MALDAEIAAVLREGRVEACLGFPPGKAPLDEIAAMAKHREAQLEVVGLGTCRTASVPMEGGAAGRLAVARLGDDPFSREELELLRGMGRILSLALRTIALLADERALHETAQQQARENARLLASLRERQTLLERLSRVQRSIATSAALQEVFDSIVAGAAELIGDPVVALRLLDPDNPGKTELVAGIGVDERLLDRIHRSPLGAGVGGRAIEADELVVAEGYAASEIGLASFAAEGLQAAMAAPVRQRGEAAGSLVVATFAAGRTYSDSEREMLTAFAEHAGLALKDARAAAQTIRQAFHDSLTGLANRRSSSIASARRSRAAGARARRRA